MLEMTSNGAFPGAARATAQKIFHLAEKIGTFPHEWGRKIFPMAGTEN